MGVVFGDTFVKQFGFHWVIVKDKYGRVLAIRYKNTSIILFPLTRISKRIERGEKVDVFRLFHGLAAKIREIKKHTR